MQIKAAIVTLGCAKNTVDSEHIKGSLLGAGVELVEDPADADYIIVNTCGFIESAKQDSIDTILELSDFKCPPDSSDYENNGDNRNPKLIVTGCLAQRYFDDLKREMPEIDILVGIKGEHDIASIITADFNKNPELEARFHTSRHPVTSPETATASDCDSSEPHPGSPVRDFATFPQRVLTDRFSAYLQIADGCDTRCSYCAIPLIRGRYHSKPFEQIIEEAKWLDEQGVKEINIIAQDTGRYGLDLYGKRRLSELLKSLNNFKNVEWLRLLYIQPFNIDDDLIDAFKQNPYLLPYIDIPFQHASSKIVEAMNRRISGNDLLALIAWIRREIPDIVIRSTSIVGFPGETDEDFAELVEFVKRAEFDYLGVFEYSDEEGTKAAVMDDKVPADIIRERYHELMDLQDLISQKRIEQKIGHKYKALLTYEADCDYQLYEARTWWQAPEVDGFTYVAGNANGSQIVDVLIEDFDGCDFHATLEEQTRQAGDSEQIGSANVAAQTGATNHADTPEKTGITGYQGATERTIMTDHPEMTETASITEKG